MQLLAAVTADHAAPAAVIAAAAVCLCNCTYTIGSYLLFKLLYNMHMLLLLVVASSMA